MLKCGKKLFAVSDEVTPAIGAGYRQCSVRLCCTEKAIRSSDIQAELVWNIWSGKQSLFPCVRWSAATRNGFQMLLYGLVWTSCDDVRYDVLAQGKLWGNPRKVLFLSINWFVSQTNFSLSLAALLDNEESRGIVSVLMLFKSSPNVTEYLIINFSFLSFKISVQSHLLESLTSLISSGLLLLYEQAKAN